LDAMEDLKKSYSRLLERARDLLVLQSAGMILHWDMETKMPPKGVELRSQQLALLQRIAHQMLTSPETGRVIKEVEKHPGFEGLGEGGKMSASQPDSAIFTVDPPEVAERKVMMAFTGGRDTVEEQRKLGGRPRVCNIYAYYYFLFEEEDKALVEREHACRSGELLCGECKQELARRVAVFLRDFQARRREARDHLDDFLLEPVARKR